METDVPMNPIENSPQNLPASSAAGAVVRGILNSASGAVPLFGGLLAAAASAWSEHEQQRVNQFLRTFLKMLEAQFEEQSQTVVEIITRLDVHDEQIADRIQGTEFQSLLRKAFRDWAGAESEQKRSYIRNILVNAAATTIVSDDVIRLFLGWLDAYSELHFSVIGVIYNRAGFTRGQIWRKLGKEPVRENSAEADLFKLLIRDLSTGGIIRQHRETDYAGNFIPKHTHRPSTARAGGSRPMISAFDETEGYELTELGRQFVHYAMIELPPKLEFHPTEEVAAGFV